MQLSNPLEMNDWPMRDLLAVILAVQFILLVTILLESLGVPIPLLRQLLGFIYLTYIPGILILRCVRIHKLGTIRTPLFAIGLSLALLMFIGLFCNFVYPFFGYDKPLSLVSLMITVSVIVLGLCVVCYLQDKTYSDQSIIAVREIYSTPTLLLCLIPFLAIFGTYEMNVYHSNLILMLLIVGIALIPFLVVLDRIFAPKHYPLAVFVIALALLYHTSLISPYLWGWDVNHEYALAQAVVTNSFWNPFLADNFNAMLSITILPVFYTQICALSLTWILKTVYPFICAVVPLAVYLVFEKQTDRKTSFLAAFFFMSLYSFFVEQPELARQEIALLFLTLFVLLIEYRVFLIEERVMSRIKLQALTIVFGTALVVSHYGMTYLFLSCIVGAFLTQAVPAGPFVRLRRRKSVIRSKASQSQASHNRTVSSTPKMRNVSIRLVVTVFVITFAWYMYVGSSSPLFSLLTIGSSISNTLFGTGPSQTPQGLAVLTGVNATLLYQLARVISNISSLLIALGLLAIIVRFCKKHFSATYLGFSAASFALLIAGVAVPYFASGLNIARLYQIALVILAPFVVIGWFAIFKGLHNALKVPFTTKRIKGTAVLLSFFLATVLVFNTGFIYQVAGDPPLSFALSTKIDYPVFANRENAAANWLYNVKDSSMVWADNYRFLLLLQHEPTIISSIKVTTDLSANGTYAFLGTRNVVQMKFDATYPASYTNFTNVALYGRIAGKEDRIYDNGGAQVYKPPNTDFTILP